jgi:hypothetical protein
VTVEGLILEASGITYGAWLADQRAGRIAMAEAVPDCLARAALGLQP